jgi:hypothetical protein
LNELEDTEENNPKLNSVRNETRKNKTKLWGS